MTFLRGFATAIACVTALLAVVAYRRSAQTARPWTECLREVVGEWDARAVAGRARHAIVEGRRAAVVEEREFDRSYGEVAAAVSGR
jgi:hypothetical protein